MPHKPILKALLVADHVYIDRTTGKVIVCGIFHQYTRRRPPAVSADEGGQSQIDSSSFFAGFTTGSPFAYVALTEVHDVQNLSLRYVRLSDFSVIFSGQLRVESPDPLLTIDIPFPLPPLPIETDGDFALELLWDDEPLGSFRIKVVSE